MLLFWALVYIFIIVIVFVLKCSYPEIDTIFLLLFIIYKSISSLSILLLCFLMVIIPRLAYLNFHDFFHRKIRRFLRMIL